MTTEQVFGAIIMYLVCTAAAFAFGSCTGAMQMRTTMRAEAAKHGAGYYEADPVTGESAFRWREFPPRTVIIKEKPTE
jgi:hypothetical protein